MCNKVLFLNGNMEIDVFISLSVQFFFVVNGDSMNGSLFFLNCFPMTAISDEMEIESFGEREREKKEHQFEYVLLEIVD